ncbi:MAG: hypothetical protein CMA07_06675 [Euryarchaeota archaeon]|nr:hypothetical protein [Euryarchaeota archaeon]|tara:strand:+ start:214 stop:1296 length:1083 start_codon:yes stop_codon:yes gene_type:complete
MKKFRTHYLEEKRVDTTATAAYTELYPALMFNNNYRPTSAEDVKKFVYRCNLKDARSKKTFINMAGTDPASAQMYIDKMAGFTPTLIKTKLENAIGITNYLYDLHASKPIKDVKWGFRDKPRGVPRNHAGDIFVNFQDGSMIGISLKAGTKKSKEPLLNSYVNTQYKKIGKEDKLSDLEGALWDSVYSKLPGLPDDVTKDNYMSKKAPVRQAYLDYYLDSESEADILYAVMARISREKFVEQLNTLSLDEFKSWIGANFNLQKPQEPPLVLVKAVKATAEQKGDGLQDALPMVTGFKAKLNTKSVQEWWIDLDTPDGSKRLSMTIRSDAGVRAGKKLAGLGKLGKFTALKLQYNGISDLA